MSEKDAECLRAAIQATEYKYFGDYELSLNERVAVDILVEFAQRHLDAAPSPGTERPGGVEA